jgi:hypothetical protein
VHCCRNSRNYYRQAAELENSRVLALCEFGDQVWTLNQRKRRKENKGVKLGPKEEVRFSL